MIQLKLIIINKICTLEALQLILQLHASPDIQTYPIV